MTSAFSQAAQNRSAKGTWKHIVVGRCRGSIRDCRSSGSRLTRADCHSNPVRLLFYCIQPFFIQLPDRYRLTERSCLQLEDRFQSCYAFKELPLRPGKRDRMFSQVLKLVQIGIPVGLCWHIGLGPPRSRKISKGLTRMPLKDQQQMICRRERFCALGR